MNWHSRRSTGGLVLLTVLTLPWLTAAVARGENLLLPLPDKHWDEAAARHLLRRAAFAGRPEEIRILSRMTPKAAVAYLVDYDGLAWFDEPRAPLLDPLLCTTPPRGMLQGFSDSHRQLYRQTRRQADQLQLQRIQAWWVRRMIESPRQLQEKMTLFWHGHLTSGYREVKSSYLLYEQNRLLRKHALDNFETLLLKISSDPAMLLYLDNARNRKAQPNENYARELMELFTLGEGHYSEADIKQAARAFTGWGVRDGRFHFNRNQHDYEPKRFMDRVGPWNGGDIIQMILEQEAAHRYIVSRLWAFFCGHAPNKSVVDGLAATFRKQHYEIRPVVRQILSSRGFYAQRSRGQSIKSPAHLVVGTVRLLDVPDYDATALNRAMAAMGQQLMQPPSVKGWDGGRKWINTATLLTRYQFAGAIVNGYPARGNEGMMRRMEQGVEAFGFLPPPPRAVAGQPPFDPRPLLGAAPSAGPQVVVEDLAARLLAVPLSAEDRAGLGAFLVQAAGGALDPQRQGHRQHLRTAIHLLMSTPEYQLH